MDEITCPYHWDCGEKVKPIEFSKHDYDFLQSALEKKMAFMIIDCPKCSRSFKFNTVQWKSDEFGYSNPNIIVEKKKKTIKQLTSILKKAEIEIPLSYFNYLISEEFDAQISISLNEEPFELYDLQQLCEKIKVDGTSCLMINQLKGFANTLLKIADEISLPKQDLDYRDIANCLTIGSGNTKLLFLDYQDNNTLWLFYPDGGDIEKLHLTLEHIIKRESIS